MKYSFWHACVTCDTKNSLSHNDIKSKENQKKSIF